MSKVFAQSVRDAILLIGAFEKGVKAHRIQNHARSTLLRNGLADTCDGDDENVIILTKVGRFACELLLELGTALNAMDRMKESAIATVLTPLQSPGRAGAIPAHRRVGGDRPAQSCGTTNTDSFDTFIASLNEAGKNRWKDPRFQGEGTVRRAQQQSRGETK